MATRKKLEGELEQNREEQEQVEEEIAETEEEAEAAPTPEKEEAAKDKLAKLQRELDDLKQEEDTLYRAFRRALADHDEAKAKEAPAPVVNPETGDNPREENTEDEEEETSEESEEDTTDPKTRSRWFG